MTAVRDLRPLPHVERKAGDRSRPRTSPAPPSPPPADNGSVHRRARWGEIASLAALPALAALRDVWAVQGVLLLVLLLVPGAVALRALRVRHEAVAAAPVYVPAASLFLLLASGLAVDLVGRAQGLAEPLRLWPLLGGLEAVCLALALAGLRAPAGAGVPWGAVPGLVHRAWPLLLALLAAAGALRLTNGHGPEVTLAAMAGALVALLVAAWRADRLSHGQLALVLYGVGLAAAWSFSVRSEFVYGWDIATEFHVAATTIDYGVWNPDHPGDAYGAMLSLTVLPSLLHALTGMGPLFLLKVVYPALLALFPVAVFGLATRFLAVRWAFAAAAFVVVQSYFFQQLPAIARQEIGLLFFVALVTAVVDRHLPRRAQLPLLAAFGLGMVVAHYSTTYLAVAVLGLALVLQLGFALRRPIAPVSAALLTAVVVTAAGAAAWYVPVTHSAQNVTGFSESVFEKGLDVLPTAGEGKGLLSSYLTGNGVRDLDPEAYEEQVARTYERERKYVQPLDAASDPEYDLRPAPVDEPVRLGPGYEGLKLAQLGIGQLANLLAVVGTLALVLRRRTGPRLRQVALLGLATLGILALLRLSGTAAEAYNQERAFMQTMVPLGIGLAWVLQAMAARWRRVAAPLALAATAALGALFVSTSGLRGALVGGEQPTNVADHGEDHERFYVFPRELAAADWLGAVDPKGVVYADRYGALRIMGATGRSKGLLQQVTPRTLDRHAWVYGSHTNVEVGRTRSQDGGAMAVYRWPRILADRWATVYDNGGAEVYRR